MPNEVYIGVDDLARKAKSLYVGVDGKARKIKKGYVGVNDKAMLFYQDYVPVESISLSPSSFTLNVPDTQQITASILPENATNKTLTWSSSNPSNLSVDENGLVTAVASGSATITATSENGISATCAATSKIPVTSVYVSPSSLSLHPGDTYTLSATVRPSNATNKTVDWNCSSPYISVSGGKVKVSSSKNSIGNYTITATCDGKVGYCYLSVEAVAVTGVSVSPSSVKVEPGGRTTLTATVSPSNATDKTVKWSSSYSYVKVSNGSVSVSFSCPYNDYSVTAKAGSYSSSSTIKVRESDFSTSDSALATLSDSTLIMNARGYDYVKIKIDSIEYKKDGTSSTEPWKSVTSASNCYISVDGKKLSSSIRTGSSYTYTNTSLNSYFYLYLNTGSSVSFSDGASMLDYSYVRVSMTLSFYS